MCWRVSKLPNFQIERRRLQVWQERDVCGQGFAEASAQARVPGATLPRCVMSRDEFPGAWLWALARRGDGESWSRGL